MKHLLFFSSKTGHAAQCGCGGGGEKCSKNVLQSKPVK